MPEEKNKVGRPATGVKRVTISFSCQPDEAEKIKEAAKKSGKTFSRFLIDCVLKKG